MSDSSLRVVYSEEYLDYNFGPGHPFTPERWTRLHSLLVELELPVEWVKPKGATDDDVLTVHSLSYVEAVSAASAGHGSPLSSNVGLGTGDVPIFYGMHEAARAVCGGTLEAARIILETDTIRVLQLGGGLHHAMPWRAAGFCVYNDVAMAIRRLVDGGMRVAFLDVDVHHSDGVQEILYNDPEALTISLHESGRYLFPGTGFETERGGPEAPGSAINFPLHPGTADASYLECFEEIVPRALRDFQPDVLVVEVGADAYIRDPLAHISLTTAGYEILFDRIVRLADEFSSGKLIVTLGGGYDVDATVRIWAMLAHRLADTPLPDGPALRDPVESDAGDSQQAAAAHEANLTTLRALQSGR